MALKSRNERDAEFASAPPILDLANVGWASRRSHSIFPDTAMRTSVVVPVIIFVLSAQPLMAQAPSLPSPDPRITSVSEGCAWAGDDNHGTYRIVLWNEGFEHVSSGVIAEWMADPEGENEPRRVVHSESLVNPGMLSLQNARIVSRKSQCIVVVTGVSTYHSTEKVSCTFELLPDKTTRAIKPCG